MIIPTQANMSSFSCFYIILSSIYFFMWLEKNKNIDLNGSEYTPVEAKVSVILETKLY